MSHEIISISAEELARQAEKERLSRQIANWTKEISLTLSGVAEMRDKWAARQKKCYDAHKAERLACAKKYRETHKEEIKAYKNKRRESKTDGRKSDVQMQYAADGGAEANCGATS